ncbi:MAG: hypothetical protein GY822_02100 [Deltaproteobacteria bacterium]|nr:hypothetical protein [Deltaproteobacteria bacterium]
MTAVLIILAIMSVPLSAILSRTFLKAREIKTLASDENTRLLLVECNALRQRIEVLESIAVDVSLPTALPGELSSATTPMQLSS